MKPVTGADILVVDDEADIREVMTWMLADEGYAVRTARHGAEALPIARDWRPHVIMLDLNMPVMDGMKLLQRMKAEGFLERTTVAVVTTEESAETEAAARKQGARHFLRKPVNRKSVEKVLAAVFGTPELARG